MSTVILEKIDILENLFRQYEITGKELAKVKRLANKLRKKDITVSVIGQFKRGKSTLVNSILQEKIMPVGIVPVTAVITSVRYGEKSAKVHFENGMIEEVAFEEMSKYVNEQENKDNVLGVSQVEITVPSEFLKTGITLVDTPGVGSVHQKNTDAAYAFVKESDAVIFMLSVDSPINQIEIAFLEKTKEFASKFYFVVNKADIVEADELEDYLVYCKNLIRSLMGIEEISLFPVSAKKETGLEPLKENIVKDCEEKGTEIMEEAALLKLRDIVESALRQISLYRAAMNLSAEDFKEKLDALETYCQGIKAEARQNCDRIITSPAYMEGQRER